MDRECSKEIRACNDPQNSERSRRLLQLVFGFFFRKQMQIIPPQHITLEDDVRFTGLIYIKASQRAAAYTETCASALH